MVLGFTEVLRKFLGSLTRKVWEFFERPAFAASFAEATASQGGYGVAGNGFPLSSAADITDRSPGRRNLNCSITFPLLAAVRFLSQKKPPRW